MPLRIVAAHFNAVAGCWTPCYPFEMKRARGFFLVQGGKAVDFAFTRAEAEALVAKHTRKAA